MEQMQKSAVFLLRWSIFAGPVTYVYMYACNYVCTYIHTLIVFTTHIATYILANCYLNYIGGLGFSVRKIGMSQAIVGVALLPFTLFYFPCVSNQLAV